MRQNAEIRIEFLKAFLLYPKVGISRNPDHRRKEGRTEEKSAVDFYLLQFPRIRRRKERRQQESVETSESVKEKLYL